jgi:ubiquinone/menaquinone biosynthesis C-methylase UbiE
MDETPLSRAEIKQMYDEVGIWQDTQGFYERPAKADLIAHADFASAASVVEIGCGTGRFAVRLLDEHLPPEAHYHGLDLSITMVALSRQRLERFGARATVAPTEGTPPFDVEPNAADRVVVNYVFDLLPAADVRAMLDEAHRVLRPGGRLCIANLTRGRSGIGRLVSGGWARLFRLSPAFVGGCRPVELGEMLEGGDWSIRYQNVVRSWGVPSEVWVAAPK